MGKRSKTKWDKTKSRMMSGGWWCAAVVIRAIEGQSKRIDDLCILVIFFMGFSSAKNIYET